MELGIWYNNHVKLSVKPRILTKAA